MPNEQLTPAHYRALQAVLEVSDASTGNGETETEEEVIWLTAKEAVRIIAEKHPEMVPDLLKSEDRKLLTNLINATIDYVSSGKDSEYLLYKKMMEVRLTRSDR